MAAGLGFKTFTTGEVLTAANVNGYLMQGILVFASAAARDSAITSPQEGQACYLKDTDAVQTYSGSAWTAVGGASGGMTLINSGGTSLTGASVTIGSIPQTYKELYLWFENVSGATDEDMFIRLNADTGSNYLSAFTRGASSIVNTADSSFRIASFSISSSRAKNTFGQLRLPLYTTTSGIQSGLCNYYSGYHEVAANGQVAYSKSAAITSITLVASGTTFDAGTAYLYGVS